MYNSSVGEIILVYLLRPYDVSNNKHLNSYLNFTVPKWIASQLIIQSEIKQVRS